MRHLQIAIAPPPVTPGRNAKLDGAVGMLFSTTGTMALGSPILTITGNPLPDQVIVGSGLGIRGAAFVDPTPFTYDPTISKRSFWPTASLRARVIARDANTITLDTQAGVAVTNAVVEIDDSLPIQAGLDYVESHGGGNLVLDAGTYPWGTPNAMDNYPVLIGDNVFLQGSGRDVTIIRLCDRAVQIPKIFVYNQQAAGYGGSESYFPTPAGLTNKNSVIWHSNQQYTTIHPTPLNDPYIVPNVGGGVRDLTLDGNIATPGKFEVKRHGALSHSNDYMAVSPDGYSASDFAGSAICLTSQP